MITSFHNVHDNFYRLFLGDNFEFPKWLVTDHLGRNVDVNVVFAKKSAKDYAEANKIIDNNNKPIYPVLTILPFAPKLNTDFDRRVKPKGRISALRDTDNDGVLDTGTEIPEPIPYDFVYQVSSASSSESHWDAIHNSMLQKFDTGQNNFFVFNKIALPLDSDIGDYVRYTLTHNDTPRSDGIFETIYTFTLTAWCHLKETSDVVLIQQLNIRV